MERKKGVLMSLIKSNKSIRIPMGTVSVVVVCLMYIVKLGGGCEHFFIIFYFLPDPWGDDPI